MPDTAQKREKGKMQFIRDRRGTTMIEWAMLAALVAIAAITILSTMGHTISSEFSKVNAAMSKVGPSVT